MYHVVPFFFFSGQLELIFLLIHPTLMGKKMEICTVIFEGPQRRPHNI